MASNSETNSTHQIEKEIDDVLAQDQRLCDVLMQVKDAHRNPQLEGCLMLSGSSVEGCLLPRWFSESPVKEVEADVMYLFGTIPVSQKHRLEDVPGQVAHLKLPYDLVMENLLKASTKEKFVDYLEHHDRYPLKQNPKYLSPVVCRALGHKMVTLRDSDEVTKQVVAELWGANPDDVSIEQNSGITGASAKDSILIKIIGDVVLKLSIDHVPCVRLAFLPDAFQAWQNGSDRDRKWPSPEIIATMAAMGCHAVPKSSEEGDDETEWRYSFSSIEMYLAAMRNQNSNVKRSYFIFKSIFYQYLEPLYMPGNDDQKMLMSYLCKTVMMWACEQHPPMDADLWKDQNLLKSVDYLLEQLQQHLANGFLAYYFMSSVNLLQEFDPRLLKLAASRIADIRSDLQCHLPKGTEGVVAMAASISEKLANAEEVAKPYIAMALFMKNLKHLCEDACENN